MPVHNSDVERMFQELADLLEIEGANPFRVRAYRNGARAVSGLTRSVSDLIKEGEDLSQYQGIGKDLAQKIQDVVSSGRLQALEEARERVDPALRTLLAVPGLGPKRVKALHQGLGLKTVEGLQKAAREGKIRSLSGFGAKTEQSILDELAHFQAEEKRYSLAEVEDVASSLERFLQGLDGVEQVTVAGSYRRRKETVGDLDILVIAGEQSRVTDAFVGYEDVVDVISHGQTRSSVVLRSGIQVDLRVVSEESFGAALHYFTGSKAHNIAVRKLGQDKGFKINEYGVFHGDELVAGVTEEEVYAAVDLSYIEPELREDRGEIQAAAEGCLPNLLQLSDLRGDLHAHTQATDGHDSLETMAAAAREMGYEYLAVTDHTHSLSMTGGLDPDRLADQIEAIDQINEGLEGFVLLKGIEVDILEDGSLDLPDWILARLDLCVCSVHSKFKLSREKQTERVLRAMDNPNFSIFGHPSGRLLGSRPAYEIDLDQVLRAAADKGCAMEVNSQPDRLDLTDTYCQAAREMGVKVAISTDAHRKADLRLIRFGVSVARRGWLEPKDVLNTRPLEELRKLIRR